MPGTWCSIEGGPPVVLDRLGGPCFADELDFFFGDELVTDFSLQCLAMRADVRALFGNQKYMTPSWAQRPDSGTRSK